LKKKLSNRDEQILLVLKKFDFLTRDQLNIKCKLGSIRNTNRILYELSDYLQTVRDGYQSIYYLSKDGREYVECEKIRKKGGHVAHTIMRNQLWIHLGCPFMWKNEIEVSDGKTKLIVDAMYQHGIHQHFLEVDNTQSMKENKLKIERYKQLYKNGLIAEKLKLFPVIVWVTTTDFRRKQLQEACRELPIVKVYTITDIK
jgi:hypothetical protein